MQVLQGGPCGRGTRAPGLLLWPRHKWTQPAVQRLSTKEGYCEETFELGVSNSIEKQGLQEAFRPEGKALYKSKDYSDYLSSPCLQALCFQVWREFGMSSFSGMPQMVSWSDGERNNNSAPQAWDWRTISAIKTITSNREFGPSLLFQICMLKNSGHDQRYAGFHFVHSSFKRHG